MCKHNHCLQPFIEIGGARDYFFFFVRFRQFLIFFFYFLSEIADRNYEPRRFYIHVNICRVKFLSRLWIRLFEGNLDPWDILNLGQKEAKI